MKHEDVALAFIAGKPAKNERMSTDGRSIMSNGSCLAAKMVDGLVVLATYRTRSGSIMRGAIQRAAYQAPRYATVRATNGLFPKNAAELRRLWEEEVAFRRSVELEPLIFGKKATSAPKTVPDYAIGTDQVDDKVVVEVWDNELDDVRMGRVVEAGDTFPKFVVTLDKTKHEDERRVTMDQGPYTDSGRFRIVAVHQCFKCRYGKFRADYVPSDCDLCGGTNIIRGAR